MKRFLCLLCWASLALAPSLVRADAYTFFEGTGYPLTVHWLRGEQPGPTAMVQGGIQGVSYPIVSDINVTLCRFGRNVRLVLLLAWETLLPTMGFLPVTSHTRAIGTLR